MDSHLRIQSGSSRVSGAEQQEGASSSNGARVNPTLSTRTEGMRSDPNQPGTSGDTPPTLGNRTASVTELSDNDEIPFQRQNIYQNLSIQTDRDLPGYIQLPDVDNYSKIKSHYSFLNIQSQFLSDINELKALTKCFLFENFDEQIDTFYNNIQTAYQGTTDNMFRLYKETRFHLRCLLMDLEVCKDDDPSDPNRKDHAAFVLYQCLESIALCPGGVYSRFQSSFIDLRASKKGLSEKLLKIRKDLFDQCITSFMAEQQRNVTDYGVTQAMEIHLRNSLHNLFCQSLNIPSIEDAYANPNMNRNLTEEFKLLKDLAISPSAILQKLVDDWSDQMSSILRREGVSAWETEVMHLSDFTPDIIDILDNELFQPINGYLGRVKSDALNLTLLMDKKGNDNYSLLRYREKLSFWVASHLDVSNDNHSSEPVTSSPRSRVRLWSCIQNNEDVSNDNYSSDSIVTVFAVIPDTNTERNTLCIGTINRAFFWVFKPEKPFNKGETCIFDTDNHITLELSHLSSINFSEMSEEVTYAIMTQALKHTHSPEDIASFFLHKNMSKLAKRTQWIIKKLSIQLTNKLVHNESEFKASLCECLCSKILDSNERSASKKRLGWLVDTPLLEPVLLRLHKSRINTTPISHSLASWDIHSFSEEGIDKLLTSKDFRRLFKQAYSLTQSGLVLRLLLTGRCDSIAKLHTSLLLFFAIEEVSSGVMYLLKRRNPKINKKDSLGNTPLMFLAATGQTECLSALLERGARVNDRSEKGLTALMFAANNGQQECVKVLLSKEGILLNNQSKLGRTALILAVIGGHVESAKLLLGAKGILVNVKDDNGSTALHHAAANGWLACINVLLAEGIDVNETNRYNRTALHYAAQHGWLACLKVLLAKGADAKKKDNYGYTPWDLATMHDHTECVNELLKAPISTASIKVSII